LRHPQSSIGISARFQRVLNIQQGFQAGFNRALNTQSRHAPAAVERGGASGCDSASGVAGGSSTRACIIQYTKQFKWYDFSEVSTVSLKFNSDFSEVSTGSLHSWLILQQGFNKVLKIPEGFQIVSAPPREELCRSRAATWGASCLRVAHI
jgi:hypothetical protein